MEFNQSEKLPQQESPKDEMPTKIEVEWDDNKHTPGVNLKLGKSTYEACIANGIFYDGMLKVPEEEKRKGIGSKLLSRLIEIAKEHDINEIWHTIQSLEGLMLINNKLKQPDRKYYLRGEEEISFQEAVEVLKIKKEEGKQNDTSIMVNSATYIDQLEE